MCILNEKGILFQDKIGVLTPDLEQLVKVLHEHAATEVCMGSIQDTRMLLQHVQLSSDCRQTQEQDEGAGRYRKENAGVSNPFVNWLMLYAA